MSDDVGMSARHSSESGDHFTPPYIVEAIRETLEVIDFDPFSNAKANEIVRATEYLDGVKLSGFAAPWHGRALINPPGGKCDNLGQPVIARTKHRGPCTETGDCGLPAPHRHFGNNSSQKLAWQKAITELGAERLAPSVFVCFSIELLQSSQVGPNGKVPLDFPIAYPRVRIPYMRPDGAVGKSPPHASCIVLTSERKDFVERFKLAFRNIGKVVVPR